MFVFFRYVKSGREFHDEVIILFSDFAHALREIGWMRFEIEFEENIMTSGSMGARSSSVGSLGSVVVRSSSNGSLQQNQPQFPNGGVGFLQQMMNQSTPPQVPSKKTSNKTFLNKEKDNAFIWIFKFAPRKKVGMLLLSIASTAAMLWILYIAKGLLFIFPPNWYNLFNYCSNLGHCICSNFNLIGVVMYFIGSNLNYQSNLLTPFIDITFCSSI